MTKTINDGNKILNPIWMQGQNSNRLTLYLGAESKYPQLLTLYMIWFDGLVLTTPKGMMIVYRYDVIGHNFINPIYECGIKQLPDINPICGQMGRPFPHVSNNI